MCRINRTFMLLFSFSLYKLLLGILLLLFFFCNDYISNGVDGSGLNNEYTNSNIYLNLCFSIH